jgi:hypothetical protein
MADVSSFGHSDLIRHSNFGIRHWVAGAAGDGPPWLKIFPGKQEIAGYQ